MRSLWMLSRNWIFAGFKLLIVAFPLEQVYTRPCAQPQLGECESCGYWRVGRRRAESRRWKWHGRSALSTKAISGSYGKCCNPPTPSSHINTHWSWLLAWRFRSTSYIWALAHDSQLHVNTDPWWQGCWFKGMGFCPPLPHMGDLGWNPISWLVSHYSNPFGHLGSWINGWADSVVSSSTSQINKIRKKNKTQSKTRFKKQFAEYCHCFCFSNHTP